MKWQKATPGNSEHPAHRLLPTLMALRQREDAPMEEGEEEVLTLSNRRARRALTEQDCPNVLLGAGMIDA